MTQLTVKRVYDSPAPAPGDGTRILVDRLWPRGVSKDKIDLWLKDVAPSTGLRKWFGHDPEKWSEFQKRYLAELKGNPAWSELQAIARQRDITLVFAAKDENHNEAVVLQQILIVARRGFC